MRTSRRIWLKLSLAGALIVAASAYPFWRKLRIRLLPITDAERRAVTRIVDLVVPADETPGAIELGIHVAVLATFEASHWDERRLAEACLWLDRRARADHDKDFVELDEPLQIELIAEMAAEPRESDRGRVFRILRNETMARYYARPESWRGLGIDGPPQPVGYPGYADPPRARSA